MQSDIKINKNSLIYSIVFNNIGKIIPLAVGVLTIPFIIKGLGLEQFGILSLMWILFGYFSLFDLGLSQATTKLVSEYRHIEKMHMIQGIVKGSLIINMAFGIVGAIVIVLITPFLATRVFTIPPPLIPIAKTSFYLIASAVPIVTMITSLRGALEGFTRYDIINKIKIPTNSLVFLIPLIGTYLNFGLRGIIALLVVLQCLTLIIYIFFCVKILRPLQTPGLRQRPPLFHLLRFGGWVAISNTSFALLANSDRFIISALLPIKTIAFYTAPFDIITKLLILPESLIPLFPVFSALGRNQSEKIISLFNRTLKHLISISGVIVVLIAVYAKDILRLWLGETFAAESATILQLLSLGVLAVSLSFLVEYLFNGLGRPDTIAKLRAVELPLYLIGAWICIKEFGLIGAAWAWTIRALFDILLLFLLAPSALSLSASKLVRGGVSRSMTWLFLLTIAISSIKLIHNNTLFYSITVMIFFIFFVIWKHWILDESDRTFLTDAVKKLFNRNFNT